MKTILNRYNELDYAEKLIEHGFLTGYKTYELKILAKYYKHKGLKVKEIKDKIYEFYKSNYENFNEILCLKKINEVLNYIKNKNNKLIITDYIYLDSRVVGYINTLNLKVKHKKFLFCLYAKHTLNKALYKANTDKESLTIYFSEDPKKQKEVYKMCKYDKMFNINRIIYDLYTENIISITKKGKLSLDFLNRIVGNDMVDLIEIKTSDINDLGYMYDKLFTNKKIIRCSICERLVTVKNLNKKICDECFPELRKRYKTLKQREYRARGTVK